MTDQQIARLTDAVRRGFSPFDVEVTEGAGGPAVHAEGWGVRFSILRGRPHATCLLDFAHPDIAGGMGTMLACLVDLIEPLRAVADTADPPGPARTGVTAPPELAADEEASA